MSEIRIVREPEKTHVFVGGKKLPHVQKVDVYQDETVIFFPAPSLNPSKGVEIAQAMDLLRPFFPGVLVGQLASDKCKEDVEPPSPPPVVNRPSQGKKKKRRGHRS